MGAQLTGQELMLWWQLQITEEEEEGGHNGLLDEPE